MIGVQIDRIIKRQSSFHPSSLTDISKLKSQVVDLNPGSSLSCCKSLMLYLTAIAFLSFHFTCWKDISALPRDTDLERIQKETVYSALNYPYISIALHFPWYFPISKMYLWILHSTLTLTDKISVARFTLVSLTKQVSLYLFWHCKKLDYQLPCILPYLTLSIWYSIQIVNSLGHKILFCLLLWASQCVLNCDWGS